MDRELDLGILFLLVSVATLLFGVQGEYDNPLQAIQYHRASVKIRIDYNYCDSDNLSEHLKAEELFFSGKLQSEYHVGCQNIIMIIMIHINTVLPRHSVHLN